MHPHSSRSALLALISLTTMAIPAASQEATGACCYGIGGTTWELGCLDDLTEEECNAMPPLTQWSPGEPCDLSPPGIPERCCACMVNPDCNDGNACTADSCDGCWCTNTPIPDCPPIGSCCYGIAGPIEAAGCLENATEEECEAMPPIALWNALPCHGGPIEGCCACLDNADCNDGDACTIDRCERECVCTNTPIATWHRETECCDPLSGARCTPTAGGVCEAAVCSLGQDTYGLRGVCVSIVKAAGERCSGEGDGDPCTYNDRCSGGGPDDCTGIPVSEQEIPCSTNEECGAATGLIAAYCSHGLCRCDALSIPATSEWGLAVMALALLIGLKLWVIFPNSVR